MPEDRDRKADGARAKNARALQRCELFSDLEPRHLERLARACRRVPLRSGQSLFDRGDAPDGLRIVSAGLVRVWLNDPDGNELTLALLGPGDPLGDMALLDGSARSASATVISQGRALYLDAADFARALDDDPTLSRHLIALLARRLRSSNDAQMELAFLPLRARLCRKLVELAGLHAKDDPAGLLFERAFSQADLGRMLGVSREAVNRQLNAMRLDGDIDFVGRRIVIRDIARLEALGTMA